MQLSELELKDFNLVTWLGQVLPSDHWAVLAAAVLALTLVVDLLQRFVLSRLQVRAKRTENLWDDAFIHAVIRPLSLFLWLFGVTLSAELAFRQSDRSMLAYVSSIWQVGLIVSATWTLIRLTRGIERRFLRAALRGRDDTPDRTTVEAVAKLARVSILIVAALVAAQHFGLSVSGVLAFGGIGGLAVGLAAKDLLANFFGGLTVYLDRPFNVGDWIASPDRPIEGVVEKIGWRQTTIRKFDRRPIYVPNATFTTITVENPSRMTHRRIYETIGIRYDDLHAMDGIVADVRELLASHAGIDRTQTMIVNFNAFAASSLDFFVYAYTKTTNWIHYHEVKQDVLLSIARIIEAHGAEIAFPTSTLRVGTLPPQFAGQAVSPAPAPAAGASKAPSHPTPAPAAAGVPEER